MPQTPINATDRTLGLVNIWQVLRKLFWEVELLKAIPTQVRIGLPPIDVLHVTDARIYAAVNACSTSLSLVDWLFHRVNGDQQLADACRRAFPGVLLDDDKAFLKSLRDISRPLNVCHQVCNASKHHSLRTPEVGFKTMVADVLYTDPDGTQLSTAMHVTHDRRGPLDEYSIDEILSSLVEWWQEKLSAIGIPGGDLFFPDAAQSCAKRGS
jgi:hypothetical protein